LGLKTHRPTYAVIFLALSIIYMCGMFLPFLYSVLHPNEDIERVVTALKEGGTAPPEAADVVEHARAAIGSLTKAIPVGIAYRVNKEFHLTGSHEHTTLYETGYFYLAWFEKRQNPTLVAIVLYANETGQKAYRIAEVNGVTIARDYAIPVLLFAVSLFLIRKRESPAGQATSQT